jgi:hypothetical protein
MISSGMSGAYAYLAEHKHGKIIYLKIVKNNKVIYLHENNKLVLDKLDVGGKALYNELTDYYS